MGWELLTLRQIVKILFLSLTRSLRESNLWLFENDGQNELSYAQLEIQNKKKITQIDDKSSLIKLSNCFLESSVLKSQKWIDGKEKKDLHPMPNSKINKLLELKCSD